MTSTADEYFAKAAAAAQAGNAAETEANFRACIAADPNHAAALLNLGSMLVQRRSYDEAELLLKRAVTAQATVDTVMGLASVFEATDRTSQALALYRDILKAAPHHAPTLKRVAALFDRSSNPGLAVPYYKQAWEADPSDLHAGIQYAVAAFSAEPDITDAVMARLLADNADNDSARIAVFTKLLLFREFHERMKRGLMPYHATSTDELFFTYAAPEFAQFRDIALRHAARNPADGNVLINKFTVLFCARDRKGAQACLDQLRPALEGHPLSMVSLDPAFYRALEEQSDAELLEGLPPLVDVTPANFTSPHISYFSCNYAYFKMFGEPLLRSFAEKTPDGQAHIHLMDASEDDLRAADAFCRTLPSITIAISAEKPGVDQQGLAAARSYYHSVRFIRFYQHVKQYGRTLWMMDVDALFNRDAREMYAVLGNKDAAFRIRAGRLEPWNQFSAAVIGATGTSASIAYFRLVAAYIAHFYRQKRLLWGIDQFAMYGAWEYLNDAHRAPTVAFLDKRVMDQDYLPEGIVWFTAGKKKFARPDAKGDVPLSAREAAQLKYWQLLDKYSRPATAP